MLTDEQVALLRCPDCSGQSLRPSESEPSGAYLVSGNLRCTGCGRAFPLRNGVPHLMPLPLAGERDATSGHEWHTWSEQLNLFLSWRRQNQAERARERRETGRDEAGRARDTFVGFCDLAKGRVLDVGCAGGYLRTSPRWNADMDYWGLDPVPTDDRGYDFPFLLGVAEHLPLADAAFDYVMIKESLNHMAHLPAVFEESYRILAPGGQLLLMDAAEEPWDPTASCPSTMGSLKRALRLLASGDLRTFARGLGKRLTGSRRLEPGATRVHHLVVGQVRNLVSARFDLVEERCEGVHFLMRANR